MSLFVCVAVQANALCRDEPL